MRYPISWVPSFLLLISFIVTASVSAETHPPDLPLKIQPGAPFGSNLFQGQFAVGTFDELNADYQIMPGDRVAVRMWGAHSFDGVLEVDGHGNLFLPEIGPVNVAGVRQADLPGVVSKRVASVFTSNVDVYTNLINAQPVAVFVTGSVSRPGRYAGGATDSVLYYLDAAGGIDPDRGSYRDVRILRDGEVLSRIDLYPFIRDGIMPRPRLEEGDVILVGQRGSRIFVEGEARHNATFEFPLSSTARGKELIALAVPGHNASHVSIVGSRFGAPYNVYLTLDAFADLSLHEGDRIRFHADIPGETIMVSTSGAIVGASRYPVLKSTRLKDLLQHIAVEPKLANLEGIHIRRKSVAVQQQKALQDALARLEKSSLSATSAGIDEANIRVREAELIAKFVEKARQIEPDGTVVVGREGELTDIYLENGDEIVIPAKSDVVLISGEVLMPQAMVWRDPVEVGQYIQGAGGFTDRADKRNILVVKPNGEVLRAGATNINAGDQVLVLPRIESKNLLVLKDISQILYQIAVAAKVAIDL